MTEAVVEKVEFEAGAEEVFEFWSDLKNVCALVQTAEETRRVDLSASLWSFRGPAGRSVEFGPDSFRGCLRHRRFDTRLGASEPDLVLGNVVVDFKPVSPDKTLLFLTYVADEAGVGGGGRASDRGPSSEVPREVYLSLHAILTSLYSEAYEARSPVSWGSAARESRGHTPSGRVGPGGQDAPASSDGVISLLEEWDAEDPAYDEETLPALKENLDHNRPEYRKLFGRG